MDPVMEVATVEPVTKEAEGFEVAGLAKAGRAPVSTELFAVDLAVLDRLLAMANAYRSEGHHRQAMELYWELAEEYPGTPQFDVARTVLLELAAAYERQGARRMARSIYERLL